MLTSPHCTCPYSLIGRNDGDVPNHLTFFSSTHLNSTWCESEEVSSLKLNLDLRCVSFHRFAFFYQLVFFKVFIVLLPVVQCFSCSPWFSGLPREGINHATMFLLNHAGFYILPSFLDMRCIVFWEKNPKYKVYCVAPPMWTIIFIDLIMLLISCKLLYFFHVN
jgi:hypothetical protein